MRGKTKAEKTIASGFCSRFKCLQRFSNFMQKAQGSLEYLIILAAVLSMTSLIVIFLSGAFSGTTYNLAACKQAASSCAAKMATTVNPTCSECETACLDLHGKDIIGIDMMDKGGGCGTGCSLCTIGEVMNIGNPNPLTHPPDVPMSEPDTVLLFHMDEGSGKYIYDNSSQNNVGVVVNANWVAGKKGTALSYDGKNDFTHISYSSALNITGNLTIEAWVYLNKYPDEWAPIVRKGHTPHMKNWNFCLFVNEGGTLGFSIGDKSTYNLATSTAVLPLNGWHHVAAVLESTRLVIYIDGVEKGSVPRTMGPQTDQLNLLQIAKAESNYLSATIDELGIYSRAKTGAEILADANA